MRILQNYHYSIKTRTLLKMNEKRESEKEGNTVLKCYEFVIVKKVTLSSSNNLLCVTSYVLMEKQKKTSYALRLGYNAELNRPDKMH